MALAACAPGPPRQPPVMFRHDARHSGVYADQPDGAFGGLRWRVQTGAAVRSTPAITDGVLYVGSGDGAVYAIDARTGDVRWRTALGSSVSSSPAVAGGLVIAGARDGSWWALDAASGAVRWTLRTGPDAALAWGHESGDLWTSSPTVAGSLVFLGGGDAVVRAVELSSGRVRWQARTAARVRATPAVADSLVVAADADGVVYAFDRETGRVRWTYATEGHGLRSADFGFDRRTIQASPAIADGAVFVGARDGYLYAIGLASGALVWRFDHDVSWVNTSPAVAGGAVFAGSSDAHFMQAVDAGTGHERWRTSADGIVWASPAVGTTSVYFADGAGWVYALDTTTGAVRWRYRTGDAVFSSPVLWQGTVYVGSDDGAIYAIRVDAAQPLERAVFWDTTYAGDSHVAGGNAIRMWLASRGYTVLDAKGLVRFMEQHAADREPSAVVFAIDIAPDSLLAGNAGVPLFRRYLDGGGTVVWPGVPPALLPRKFTDLRQVDRAGPARLLGVTMERGNFDAYGTISVTDAGRRLGLVPGWISRWSADPDSVEILATDELGLASAWARRYGGPPGTGFIRVPVVQHGGTVANTVVLQTAAELRP